MDKQHTTINKQVKITANENPSTRTGGLPLVVEYCMLSVECLIGPSLNKVARDKFALIFFINLKNNPTRVYSVKGNIIIN